MFGELYYLIWEFLTNNFFSVFEDIYLDNSNVGSFPLLTNNDTYYNLIEFTITIVSIIIIILIIGLFIYLIYRLIMFIVRRFVNV